MPIASINPATGATLAAFEPHDDREVDRRLERASSAAIEWRRRPVADRTRVVGRLGTLLEERKRQLGELMTLEMGKPLRAAVEEAAKCALACRFYAEHAADFLAPEPAGDGDGTGDEFVAYQPLGVVLAVMPWNFPFWQVVRFAAPAIAAGNVGLLKHASNVPQCALALEALVREAGAPEGVFQTLLIGADRVSRIIEDVRVAAVTLTGSEAAGSQVAAAAGKHLKKTVLELGGSDPFVVLPSADLDAAVATAVRARAINNGQSCIAAKRFIVADAVYDRFVPRFADGMRALRVGDPMRDDPDVGPLASPQIVEDLERQVRETVAAGARVLAGGRRRDGAGNFFEPTVLVDVPHDSAAAREELFGPVAPVFRARDADDAVRIANDTAFGLGASVWTTDRAEAGRVSAAIEAGTVFVNGMVASDPRFPFGGVKASGYGRELGALGMREFMNVKTVRMRFGATEGAASETE